ncbi:ABC transporter substrate-binding protein (plasmid) [Embleya sp. NBC_00888]|uniref:ABC transporter substrate-binding protein n=1 Tax=Embleya sp. NBC_00888 TaxID=2975960 RepID=UPI002F90E1D7|nr:ABC transporter substrate-binding protein [Embleya sp. NBC_00888]
MAAITTTARTGLAVAAGLALMTSCVGVKHTDTQQDAAPVSDAKLVAPIADMTCDTSKKPTGEPIVVGGSLSLTGPLAPTAVVHDEVARIVTKWVNECGGIDGRPLQWKVLDDQSTPTQVTSNYQRLIGDKVALVMGPYGGAATLAGAGPVTDAGYAYFTHTNGAPNKLIGENHFPAWQIGGGVNDPSQMFAKQAETFWDALQSSGHPPKSVFFATSKFPTTLSYAAAATQRLKQAGVKVVGSVEYDLTTTDFNAIVTRIAAADPDLVYVGGLGADVTNLYQAFDALGYKPRSIFVALPAPAAVAALGPRADGLLLSSLYENHAPLGGSEVARYFANAYGKGAAARKILPVVETQAAASFSAWQILLTGVLKAGVDNKAIIDYLNAHKVDTLAGTVSFDGFNNYGSDFNRVAQMQNGKRVLVWPKDVAGAEIQYQP